MNYEWLSWDEYKEVFTALYNSNSANPISMVKSVYFGLTNKYANGKDWLSASDRVWGEFKNYHFTELFVIVPWAFKKGICSEKCVDFDHNRDLLLDYYLSKRVPSSTVFRRWAIHFKLITEEELLIIQEFKPLTEFIIGLAIHTFILSKPLNKFTPDDVILADRIPFKSYTPKGLQNILVTLGYSDIPGKPRRKKSWDFLICHDKWGSLATNYYNYLLSNNVTPQYLCIAGHFIKSLFSYLTKYSLEDCSCFKYDDYLQLLDFMKNGPSGLRSKSSLVTYIQRIKHFFYWGYGDPFFPKDYDFPEEYWNGLQKEAKTEYLASKGLAFSSPEAANKIAWSIINYNSNNDIEMLCKYFWMIAISSTPRFSFILQLESGQALKRLPNEPSGFGLYSLDEDKAGNVNGQFPLIDSVGVEAINYLEDRVKRLNLKPIYDSRLDRSFIHLFQLTTPPWLLGKKTINNFLRKLKTGIEVPNHLLKGSAHAFRTHLLTHIAVKTGSIEAVRVAAGHRDQAMTKLYLKSPVSKNALLYRAIEKYEQKEITGNFYYKLIWLITAEDAPIDDMMRALTTDMTMEKFISDYGKRLETGGYCFNKDSCNNWFNCWSCHHFLICRDEVGIAIKTLVLQLVNFRELKYASRDFSYNNPLAYNQIKAIAQVTQRIEELGISQQELEFLVENHIESR